MPLAAKEIPQRHGYPAFDFLRWLMATLVMVYHLRDLIFLHPAHDFSLSIFDKFFYLFTAQGHSAVIVFFVLSGFFVGGKLLQAPVQTSAMLNDYLIDRTARIYVVLVPTLALTFVLDHFGATVGDIYRADGWSNLLPHSPIDDLNWLNFFSSLLNLTFVVGKPFGTNGPLWSLAYEWIFYLAFPLLLASVRQARDKKIKYRNLIGMILLVAVCLYSPTFSIYLIIWMGGALVRYLSSRYNLPRNKVAFSAAAAAVPASMFFMRSALAPDWLKDCTLAFSVMALLYRPEFANWRALARLNETLAGFSFSLYVVHVPVAIFCIATLEHFDWFTKPLPPGPSAYVVFGSISLVTYIVAYIFSLGTEAQTVKVKRWIRTVSSFFDIAVARGGPRKGV